MTLLNPATYADPAHERLVALPWSWFREPRGKEDHLRELFGPDWHIGYVPARDPQGWTLHGYLMTADGLDVRLLATYQDMDQGRATGPRGLRSHLRSVVAGIQVATTLPSLIDWNLDRAAAGNPQGVPVARALFEVVLREHDVEPAAATALRTLAALSDFRDLADLVAEIETAA